MQRALDTHVHHALRPLLAGLAIFYALLAMVAPFFFSKWDAPSWALTAGQFSVFVTYAVLYGLSRRDSLPLSWVHPILALIVLLPLADSLAHTFVRANPLETLSYVIVPIGAALVFTSAAWYFGFLGIALAAWAMVAPLSLGRPMLADLAFVLVQGAVAGAVAFHVRLSTLRRLESLRWLAEQRGAQVARQNQRLLELDQLKTEFVNAVSHDLRTPLTSIKGYGEFLVEEIGGPLSPQQQGFVRQIQLSSERLERLVNDLLDFARIEAGTFQLRLVQGDLRQPIVDNAESLRPAFQDAGVALVLELPDAPVAACFDPQRIDQVLGNLLSNALKFTPPQGCAVVRLLTQGDRLRVEVSDSGPGIAPGDLGKLFQRFSQLQAGSAKGGTGLGLSISKALVTAHGGEIGVESEPGKGSTFWFALPREPG